MFTQKTLEWTWHEFYNVPRETTSHKEPITVISAKKLGKDSEPGKLAKYLKRSRPKKMTGGHGAHHGPAVSVRTTQYKGHEIEIRTSYEIKIDGKLLKGHMGVGDDGRVHYHPIPAYSSASMVELMCSVIDAFPDDYPPVKKQKRGKRKKKARKKPAGRKPHKGEH